jgi:hypothetical protein
VSPAAEGGPVRTDGVVLPVATRLRLSIKQLACRMTRKAPSRQPQQLKIPGIMDLVTLAAVWALPDDLLKETRTAL